jgi:DNA polymerase-3 subunit alpha
MGKKNPEIMARMKEEFIEGAVKRDVERETVEKIFEFCATFARYGFNRSHSASYAMLAYRCAWLKTHYPVEFMAATMSSEMDNTDRIRVLMRECRRLNIPVDPPNVNVSHSAFTAVGDRILFGLSAVKNVGEGAVEVIVASRDANGPFTTLFDFAARVDSRAVNKRAAEALVASGAMDCLEGHRAQLLASLDGAIAYGAQAQADRRRGQASLFDGKNDAGVPEPVLSQTPPWPAEETSSREKEALGFFVSNHPLSEFADELELFATATTDQVGDLPDESEIQIGGVITQIRTQTDRKQQQMAFLTLEDFGGTIEVICFADPFRRYRETLRTDALVLLGGRLSTREGERPKLILESATALADALRGAVLDIHISLLPDQVTDGTLDQLESVFRRYDKGNGIVYIYFPIGAKTVKVKSNRIRLEADRHLMGSLRELLGEDAVYCTRG